MNRSILCIAASAFLARAVIAQTPRYSIVDLGTSPGGSSSMANVLNDNRLVGGQASGPDGVQQAVLWGGPFRVYLGTPGLNSGVFGVNNSGQAAINGEAAANDPFNENFCSFGTGLRCIAYQWQRGAMTALPTLGGNNAAVGNINNKGEIIGAAETATMDPDCPSKVLFSPTGPQVLAYEAVVWGPKLGDIRQLKPLPGDKIGMALWINDNNEAAGATGTCANSVLPPLALGPHAVMRDKDGTPHDLGNLGAKAINMALSINNQSQVTGTSSLIDEAHPGNGHHAFLWTAATGMKDLGALPGDTGSVGAMINDAGDIVGVSFDLDGNPRPFLWHKGTMSDLNDMVAGKSPLQLVWATAINERGEISGFGATAKGDLHGFLATPAGQ